MRFEDLTFHPHPNDDGKQARVFFNNGFGASIISSGCSYGGEAGLYELAVLKGSAAQSSLTYDTPITDDVLGWLSESDVTDALALIEAL